MIIVAVAALLGSAVAEAQSLAAPGSVSASTISTTQIGLSWNDPNPSFSGFQEAGYIVQQQTEGQAGWTKVFMSDPNVTSWTASGLAIGTTYNFRIKAYMFVGSDVVYSAYSAVASATTQTSDFPDAPTNLTSTALSSSQIKLNWHDNASNETGFIVSRAPAFSGLWVAVATLGKVSTYTDSGLGAGTAYAYKVRAYNSAGKSGPSNVVIETTLGTPPNQLPVADAGPDRVTQTLTALSFDGSASFDPDGQIVSYQWNFGDGSTASGVTANHAFATPGTYTVTLTVTDNAGGQASNTASVNATNRAPTANAGASQTALVNTPVSFSGAGSSDPDGTITSYAWTFGDGGSSNGSNVSHTYANTGSFTVTLTVTDNSGAHSTATASVIVNPVNQSGGGGTQWSKRVGGAGGDSGMAITLDRSANLIVAGVVTGAVNFGGGLIPGSGNSAFVAKYSPSKSYLWAKRFDGSTGSSSIAYAVATDPNNGNIFVTGTFIGIVDFGGGPLTSVGWGTVPNYDVFIAAYSPSGSHLWSVSFGGGVDDFGYGLAVASNGDVIITGQIGGRLNIGCGIMSTTSSSHDMFLARFGGSSGTCQWAKFVGGSAEDAGTGVAIAANGDIVVSGYFQGTANFGGGAVTSAGLSDIFVARYTGQGTYLWARTFGSTGDDRANAVALDGSGNVAIAGHFSGTVNFGGTTLTSGGSWDAFAAKYSASGGLLWAKDLGGTSTDEAFGVDVDASGNVIAVGGFQGTMNVGGVPVTSNGFWDVFVGKFSAANGDPMWFKSFGGSRDDLAYGVTVDGNNSAIVTGYFQDTVNFAGPEGAFGSAGLNDMFIIGLAP